MKLAYGVVAYLYGVRKVGIRFVKVKEPRLEAFYDASNKGDPADGDKAQGGYVIFLGHGPLDWRAFRLVHVGLSAQHNEYMVLAVCSQAVAWLRSLLEDFGLTMEIEEAGASLTDDPWNDRMCPIDESHDFGNLGWDSGPTPTLGDNNAAINLATEDLITVQNRFYSRLCHYAKKAFERKITNPLYVPTADNWADGFTKALGAEPFQHHFPYIRGLLAKHAVDPGRRQSGARQAHTTPAGGSSDNG